MEYFWHDLKKDSKTTEPHLFNYYLQVRAHNGDSPTGRYGFYAAGEPRTAIIDGVPVRPENVANTKFQNITRAIDLLLDPKADKLGVAYKGRETETTSHHVTHHDVTGMNSRSRWEDDEETVSYSMPARPVKDTEIRSAIKIMNGALLNPLSEKDLEIFDPIHSDHYSPQANLALLQGVTTKLKEEYIDKLPGEKREQAVALFKELNLPVDGIVPEEIAVRFGGQEAFLEKEKKRAEALASVKPKWQDVDRDAKPAEARLFNQYLQWRTDKPGTRYTFFSNGELKNLFDGTSRHEERMVEGKCRDVSRAMDLLLDPTAERRGVQCNVESASSFVAKRVFPRALKDEEIKSAIRHIMGSLSKPMDPKTFNDFKDYSPTDNYSYSPLGNLAFLTAVTKGLKENYLDKLPLEKQEKAVALFKELNIPTDGNVPADIAERFGSQQEAFLRTQSKRAETMERERRGFLGNLIHDLHLDGIHLKRAVNAVVDTPSIEGRSAAK